MSPLVRLPALAAIRLYQVTLAPFTGHCCRFEPSCSHYAADAVKIHGVARGSWLAFTRVLRCNPFAKAGFDPVPKQ